MLANPDNPFVGTGWSFPVGVNAVGGIATVQGVDEIEQAMHIILATAPGERPMRPDFGCGLMQFLFEPVNVSTAQAIARAVEQALRRWEPRIDVEVVEVHIDDTNSNRVFIDIKYVISDTYEQRSLVFPFYVIPDHE